MSESYEDLLDQRFMGILGKKFKKTVWYYWVFTRKETKNFNAVKKEITEELKKMVFIS